VPRAREPCKRVGREARARAQAEACKGAAEGTTEGAARGPGRGRQRVARAQGRAGSLGQGLAGGGAHRGRGGRGAGRGGARAAEFALAELAEARDGEGRARRGLPPDAGRTRGGGGGGRARAGGTPVSRRPAQSHPAASPLLFSSSTAFVLRSSTPSTANTSALSSPRPRGGVASSTSGGMGPQWGRCRARYRAGSTRLGSARAGSL
jgi:hypothetical protein